MNRTRRCESRGVGARLGWRLRLGRDRHVGKGSAMGRVAVIGDVGGHLLELEAALASLGATGGDHRLPDDLTVVQVGDLIDRGPDSAGVLDLVDRYLDNQPAQWVQLIGNHEAQYLP